MIRHVVLHNWKSHHRTEAEFEAGTNVIIGINGAGKSSVLEGIYFALFGPPEKRGFYERAIREGEKEGYVELSFSHGGKTYTVKRWFDRKGQKDARIEGDEKVITSRPRDVDEKIMEILGMDGKMFKDSVYARQNEMASILLDSKRRKEMIDDMIEISGFSRVRDAVVALRNRLREWVRGAETIDYEDRLAELSTQRSRKEGNLKGKEGEMAELENRASDFEKTLKDLEGRAKSAEETYRKLQTLRAKLQEIRGEIQGAERKIMELRDAGEPRGNEEQVLTELQEEYRKIREYERRLTTLQSKIETTGKIVREKQRLVEEGGEEGPNLEELRRNLEEREEELERVDGDLREKSQKTAALEAELRNVERNAAELEREVERLEKIAAEMERIRERYGEVEQELEDKRMKVRELSEKLAEARSKLSQEQEFVRALEGINKCPVCDSELGDARALQLRREHESRVEELKKRIDSLGEELRAEEQEVEDLKKIAEKVVKLREEAASMEEKKAQQKEANVQREKVEEMLVEIRKGVEDLSGRKSRLVAAIRDAREKKERAARVAAAKEEIERMKEEVRNTEGEIREVERLLAGKSSEDVAKNIKIVERRLELLHWKQKMEELVAERRNLEENVQEVQGAEEEYRSIIEERAKVDAELRSTRSRIMAVRSELEELKRDLQEIEAEIKRVIEQKNAVEKRRAILNVLNRMIPAVESAREQVRELRIKAINKALNIVWRGLYPRKDLPEIRLHPEGSDYVLEVKRGGRWISVTGLSGGEFYDAALALRIAISSLRARILGLLILDEPTHNLDADATEALTHILNKLPEYGLFKQIIVITHNEALQRAATGTVHIFERDKDRNKPTDVRKLAVAQEME